MKAPLVLNGSHPEKENENGTFENEEPRVLEFTRHADHVKHRPPPPPILGTHKLHFHTTIAPANRTKCSDASLCRNEI